MKRQPDAWENWFVQHRGSELADLVIRLCRTLMERGHYTADDGRAVRLLGDPRIRGAAVRAPVRWGFARAEEYQASASDVCHHRDIRRFVLVNPAGCRAFLARVDGTVLGCYDRREPSPQLMLAV